MKHNYHQHREKRLQRAKAMAQKKFKESVQYYDESQKMAELIPMGQKILVDHHSEKWDRRYRERIGRIMDKSIQAYDEAVYYNRKAAAIGNNKSISSDDPNALEKLQQKLEYVIANHAYMKKANVFLRKGDKACFLQLKGSSEAVWDELHNYAFGDNPPTFNLQYALAEKKRIQDRIKAIRRYEGLQNTELTVQGFRLVKNIAANRVFSFHQRCTMPLWLWICLMIVFFPSMKNIGFA